MIHSTIYLPLLTGKSRDLWSLPAIRGTTHHLLLLLAQLRCAVVPTMVPPPPLTVSRSSLCWICLLFCKKILVVICGISCLFLTLVCIKTVLYRIVSSSECIVIYTRAATSTDFCNWLTGPPKSNHIWLTERFASPYGALCFHVFTGSDSQPGPSRLSWQFASLLVSNQTSFTQIKRLSKTITCDVLMHKKQISNLMSFTHRVIKNKAR